MTELLEVVPNFSEGRDRSVIDRLVDAMESSGAKVLHHTSDPDHHRSVVTAVGTSTQVTDGMIAAAEIAIRHIDLTLHSGVHPRIGAMDVVPYVPLLDTPMEVAVRAAHRTGEALASLGVPVYYYREASSPPGKPLHEVRRGGFEAVRDGYPDGRLPDLPTHGPASRRAHPTAGASCVGARSLLLAWNVYVSGMELSELRSLARGMRETGGGHEGLRALALELPSKGRLQLSMNLEDMERTSPMEVFHAIEEAVESSGGRVAGTEVIGMIPDGLLASATADRIALQGVARGRLLSHEVARVLLGGGWDA